MDDPKQQQGTALAWRNLTVEVSEWSGLKRQKKTILRQLTGSVQSGTLTCLLGPSGAGKTTLLKLLSGSNLSAHAQSEIYAIERRPTSYYIAQHVTESIIGELTVGQTLAYAYGFKNGHSHSAEQLNGHIATVLESLLLPDSLLDRSFSLCSGGEQKRIAIAQELMVSTAPPDFLFLDEPTSGLDSAAALEVMASLRKLAQQQGITVIASIHAPNSETLVLCDQLYILAKGGVAIFSGPPGGIRDWLEDNLQLAKPPSQPPIETIIKIACRGLTEPTVWQLANCTLRKVSSATKTTQRLVSLPSGLSNLRKSFTLGDLFLGLCRLSRVTFLARFRPLLLTLAIFTLYLAVLSSAFPSSMTLESGCVSLSGNQSTGEPQSMAKCFQTIEMQILIQENIFFLTMVLLFTGMITICTSAATFSLTIKVFRSEHTNGWYSLGVFYVTSLAVTFAEVSLYALLTGSLSYVFSGQHSVDGYSLNVSRFAVYLFFLWLLTLYLQSFGHLIGLVLVNHLDLAIIFSLVYYIGSSMINGLFVDLEAEGNVLLQEGSSLLAFKFISRGILYAIYGIDRCDAQKDETSIAFHVFHVDPRAIGGNTLRVLLNVFLIRLVTFLVLYLKFGSVCWWKRRKSGKNGQTIDTESEAIKLDFNFPENTNILLPSVEEKGIRKPSEGSSNTLRGKILFAWRNLSLFASNSLYERENALQTTAKQTILRNLNGQVTFGSLNALMGTSGAGKTSLLKVLNGRYKARLPSESVFHLSRYAPIKTCFITQDVSGHLPSGLTAKQLVVYASRFKNRERPEMGAIDHGEIANRWLAELDLTEAAGTMHRSTMVDACSGGERKRLAVALELTALAMPNCVCIDEPTSGLDSNSAETVISILYKLTRTHPMAIITSIHQPTSRILEQFDQLYILARGGVAIYSGPPSGMGRHLEAALCPRVDSFSYQIETLIKYSCSSATAEPIVQAMVSLTNQKQVTPEADLAVSKETVPIPARIGQNRVRFSLHSVRLLLSRSFLTLRQHSWAEHLFFSVNYLFYGLVLLIFFNSSMVTQTGCINLQADFNPYCNINASNFRKSVGLLNNFKYTFFAGNFFFAFILIQSSLSFLRVLPLTANEHRNGWYSSGAFYLAQSAFDLATLLPVLLLYVAIFSYWYLDLFPGIYWSHLGLFLLSAAAIQGLGHFYAQLVRGSVTLLLVTGASLFLCIVLLSNFFLLTPRLGYVYQTVSNLVVGRFFFDALMLLQYGFGRCAEGDISFTLYSMGLSDGDYWHCLQMILFHILLYRAVALYTLLRRTETHRTSQQKVAIP